MNEDEKNILIEDIPKIEKKGDKWIANKLDLEKLVKSKSDYFNIENYNDVLFTSKNIYRFLKELYSYQFKDILSIKQIDFIGSWMFKCFMITNFEADDSIAQLVELFKEINPDLESSLKMILQFYIKTLKNFLDDKYRETMPYISEFTNALGYDNLSYNSYIYLNSSRIAYNLSQLSESKKSSKLFLKYYLRVFDNFDVYIDKMKLHEELVNLGLTGENSFIEY